MEDVVTDPKGALTYWEWIRSEASLVDTDGCTGVSGLRIECCFEHDLAFRTGKEPRDAFRLARLGSLDPWGEAKRTTFEQANERFLHCLQTRSKWGFYSPMAWWRWVGVMVTTRDTWDCYRAAEQVKQP